MKIIENIKDYPLSICFSFLNKVRFFRLKREKSKSRKYGVLTNGMEMDHLESDSDDEDTTVFELNHRR